MELIRLYSEEELIEVAAKYPCSQVLDERYYSVTRYVSQDQFESLIQYSLLYEPYLEVAKNCSMSWVSILRSEITNRFYIGLVNLGGHGAVYEIRPITIERIKDVAYIHKMFANHGRELDQGIELNQEYQI